jgi:hypothetical protein
MRRRCGNRYRRSQLGDRRENQFGRLVTNGRCLTDGRCRCGGRSRRRRGHNEGRRCNGSSNSSGNRRSSPSWRCSGSRRRFIRRCVVGLRPDPLTGLQLAKLTTGHRPGWRRELRRNTVDDGTGRTLGPGHHGHCLGVIGQVTVVVGCRWRPFRNVTHRFRVGPSGRCAECRHYGPGLRAEVAKPEFRVARVRCRGATRECCGIALFERRSACPPTAAAVGRGEFWVIGRLRERFDG